MNWFNTRCLIVVLIYSLRYQSVMKTLPPHPIILLVQISVNYYDQINYVMK